MSTRPSGRLISTASAHGPSPSAPISTSLKTQATHPPSVRERARKYPTAVAPPISRRSHRKRRDIPPCRGEPAMLRRLHPLAQLPYCLSRRFSADAVYSAYYYMLAAAEKP